MKIPLVDLKANYCSMKEAIDNAIDEVIDKSAFIGGDIVRNFESNYAKFCKVKYAIGCANGTSALHLALLAAGIGKGDEVITVPNTYISTTEAISYVGGKIKFVDAKEDTALIDIDALEKAITPQTRAILTVHLYGQMADMGRIRDIAQDNNLLLIEDAAQAHGAEWKGHQPGYYGDIATYSFFPAKILGCFGEGGCVTTNNSQYAKIVEQLKDHGRTGKYLHMTEGFGYRLDTLQAAILNAKLFKLRSKIYDRQLIAQHYNYHLKYEHITEEFGADSSYYMYVLKVKNRQKFMSNLKENGISTGIHYPIPLHLQPAYSQFNKKSFPVAEKLAKEIVSIPAYPELARDQLRYIVKKVNEA